MTIRLSRLSLLESIKINLCLVLTMAHHLLLSSIAHWVFSCSKHHGPPKNSPECPHRKAHLQNLLCLTQPCLPVQLIKDHLLLLVSLLVHFHPKPFPHTLTIAEQFLQAIIHWPNIVLIPTPWSLFYTYHSYLEFTQYYLKDPSLVHLSPRKHST